VGGALTTVGSVVFLWPCFIHPFMELGIMIFSNMCLALLFTFLFLVPLLMIAGPRGHFCSIYVMFEMCRRSKKDSREKETEQRKSEKRRSQRISLRKSASGLPTPLSSDTESASATEVDDPGSPRLHSSEDSPQDSPQDSPRDHAASGAGVWSADEKEGEEAIPTETGYTYDMLRFKGNMSRIGSAGKSLTIDPDRLLADASHLTQRRPFVNFEVDIDNSPTIDMDRLLDSRSYPAGAITFDAITTDGRPYQELDIPSGAVSFDDFTGETMLELGDAPTIDPDRLLQAARPRTPLSPRSPSPGAPQSPRSPGAIAFDDLAKSEDMI